MVNRGGSPSQAALLLTAAFAAPVSINAAFSTHSPPPLVVSPSRTGGVLRTASIGVRRETSYCNSQRCVGTPPRATTTITALRSTTVSTETAEDKFDNLLSNKDLRGAIRHLRTNPDIQMPKDRLLEVFSAIEVCTAEAEENNINTRLEDVEYPPTSPARSDMTDMYAALSSSNHLPLFGAASNDRYPAKGSKVVTPTLLENVTDLSMVSLTPKPSNALLIAGSALALSEGIISLVTGINLNFLILMTLLFAFFDRILLNGALFESATKLFQPEVNKKILKHEAGHFLCAYLLGCPVEGCVLNAWAALRDARFGGRRTNVSAGTSFFDPELSDQINGRKPLSRSSIDRYSVIVMGGIAAEAINFGRADGGASDEMALVRFLTQINPRGGGAVAWDSERIKNQARWGAMQAVLLLRHYRGCYDALVEALESGGDLGDCVYAIEKAGREKGLRPMNEPEGYILDKGLYGEWSTEQPPPPETVVPVPSRTVGVAAAMPSMERENVDGSSEQLLKEYRKMVEDKLKDIDARLSEIDGESGV